MQKTETKRIITLLMQIMIENYNLNVENFKNYFFIQKIIEKYTLNVENKKNYYLNAEVDRNLPF